MIRPILDECIILLAKLRKARNEVGADWADFITIVDHCEQCESILQERIKESMWREDVSVAVRSLRVVLQEALSLILNYTARSCHGPDYTA